MKPEDMPPHNHDTGGEYLSTIFGILSLVLFATFAGVILYGLLKAKKD